MDKIITTEGIKLQNSSAWAKEMGVQWIAGLGLGLEIEASKFAIIEALLSKSFPYALKVPGEEHMLGLSFDLYSQISATS